MVNVRIHEPLNPFIDNLPPPPYPVRAASTWRGRARARRSSRRTCATCHTPRNQTIYPASTLGVDPNRTMVNTSVSRYGLAALVMEACTIYGLNNQGQPGADWCMPKGDWQARLDEYFRDTPRRVAEGTNGYKADMLRGIWAQAPYLHNGSVPTLGQLVCPSTRPRRFLRGNLYYDEALVGFEWSDRPKARYGPDDTILIKEYDTTVPGKANTGHTYGADLCPDTTGLDPIADRRRDRNATPGLTSRSAARVPEDAVAVKLEHRTAKSIDRGSSFPLGATPLSDGVNFALYSKYASDVFLLLFDAPDAEPTDIIQLRHRDKFIWHAQVQGRQSRPAVRLQGAGRLSARVRTALQRREAAARPVRKSRHREIPQREQPAAGLRRATRRGRAFAGHARQHLGRSESDRHR